MNDQVDTQLVQEDGELASTTVTTKETSFKKFSKEAEEKEETDQRVM
jgi:hypothetical protein